jgi:hypothetical protein
MKLTFYGRRGAVPVCEADFQELGGNTTCVHLAFPDTQTIAILDAGTELKNLGRDLLATGHRQEQRNLLRFFLEFTALPRNICSKPHRHHDLRSRIPGRPGCLRMGEILWPVPLSQCR